MLVDEPFAKALQIFETCVLVNYNLCGKLVSSVEFPIKFDKRFKVTSVTFFVADFNLLSCELNNLHLTCYIESFYINILLKRNKIIIIIFLSLLQ